MVSVTPTETRFCAWTGVAAPQNSNPKTPIRKALVIDEYIQSSGFLTGVQERPLWSVLSLLAGAVKIPRAIPRARPIVDVSLLVDRKEPRQYAVKSEVGNASKEGEKVMARDGFKILDSDMHVFEPHDLYLKYMNPKWGDRIPRGEPRKKHGQIRFTYADGKPIRSSGVQALSSTTPKPIPGEAAPGEDSVAHRYDKPLRQNYDAFSQLEAMNEEGLDVAVLFRTFPLHCDDSL
jgi:hypothetical protein